MTAILFLGGMIIAAAFIGWVWFFIAMGAGDE